MATGGQRVLWCGYWPMSRQHGDVMPSSSHSKIRHEIHLYSRYQYPIQLSVHHYSFSFSMKVAKLQKFVFTHYRISVLTKVRNRGAPPRYTPSLLSTYPSPLSVYPIHTWTFNWIIQFVNLLLLSMSNCHLQLSHTSLFIKTFGS